MGARGYDPLTASFLSVDPLAPVVGAAWGSNPYSFAGNNPVNQVDPWGLRPITDAELADYQKAHQGYLADAGDFFADNWEYFAAAGMAVAGVALMATGLGGPLGGMLVAGGVSMVVQKATTGSVDPVQLAMDMVPGGPVIQAVCGAGSAAYSYMKHPGPHNVSGLLGDVTVAAGVAALPGPSSAGKKLVGGGIETLERGALKSASKDASGIAGGGASSANPRIGELSPVPEPQFVQPIGPVEAKAHQVLDTIDQKGVTLSGFKGGKIWENNGKGAVLPSGKNEPISYREWDVDPKVKGIPEQLIA